MAKKILKRLIYNGEYFYKVRFISYISRIRYDTTNFIGKVVDIYLCEIRCFKLNEEYYGLVLEKKDIFSLKLLNGHSIPLGSLRSSETLSRHIINEYLSYNFNTNNYNTKYFEFEDCDIDDIPLRKKYAIQFKSLEHMMNLFKNNEEYNANEPLYFKLKKLKIN